MLPKCITRAEVDSGRLYGEGKRTYDPRARLVPRAFEPQCGRQLLREGGAIASVVELGPRDLVRPQPAQLVGYPAPLRSPTHALLRLSRCRSCPTAVHVQCRGIARPHW